MGVRGGGGGAYIYIYIYVYIYIYIYILSSRPLGVTPFGGCYKANSKKSLCGCSHSVHIAFLLHLKFKNAFSEFLENV